MGVSIEHIEDAGVDRSQINPKVGLLWAPSTNSLLRTAWFRTSKRSLLTSQTLEPTNVAGFNQFYDAITASDIWHLGFGYDQRLSSSIWAGLELSRRNVNSPYLGDPAEGERLTGYSIYDTGRAYLYWAATDRVAVSFGAEIERRRDDNDSSLESLRSLKTQRLPITIRYFERSGWIAELGMAGVRQDGVIYDHDLERVHDDDTFVYLRGAVGYRLPRQAGLISVEGENLLSKSFRYQDLSPVGSHYFPELGLFARNRLAF